MGHQQAARGTAQVDGDDPIVAIATAAGRGAVGVVRLSGPSLQGFAEAICCKALSPRQATLVTIVDAAGAPIDRVLGLWFQAPHSYTGEDVLELQAHGGAVVLQLLVARCLEVAATPVAATGDATLPRLRLARAGEFTQRAFLNDKLDLAQAEAVADLIDAGTEAAARSAARSLSGAFSEKIDALAEQLVGLRLLVEATLDFPDEEVEFLESAGARERLEEIARKLEAVLHVARQGAILRDGIHVVLAGQPNVGKSSLLNALAGAELAIVTPIAGTTRDKVAETIQIEGVAVHVVDTAGLRDAGNEVERIGVARSWAAIDDADVVVFLHDLTRLDDADHAAGDARIAERLAASKLGDRVLHVFNKADVAEIAWPGGPPSNTEPSALSLSALTGKGLAGLRSELLRRSGWQIENEGVFMARARHVDAIRRAGDHVAAADRHAAQGDAVLELVAEELRLAHDALGEITGTFTADDLLGAIFSRFCIGK